MSIDSPGSGFGAGVVGGTIGGTFRVGDACWLCGTFHDGLCPTAVAGQPTWNPPTVILPFVPIPAAPTAFAFTTRISDEDVDRIAKRVVELLKEAKP